MGLIFRKHTVNEKYFPHWSERMAYLLGFIYADGNIAWDSAKGYYSLTITASEKDKDHLEKIRKVLQSTKPLLYGESTKSYRLIVNNKKICRRLMKLGVFPRKSLIIKFPQILQKYIRSFIRGYIDGDGSVKYFARKRSPYFEVTISSGSKKFIASLKDKIHLNLNINSVITKSGMNCYLLRYSCKRGLKLAEWLYQDADFYIIRKFNKYQEAISSRKE